MEDKIVEILKEAKEHNVPFKLTAEVIAQLYSAREEVRNELETKLLDAINAGLIKWGAKEKLSFQDGFNLLSDLQDKIMAVKLTRLTVSEEERTEAEKHEILQGFCEKISQQQDISPEFAAIVQRHFWDLI